MTFKAITALSVALMVALAGCASTTPGTGSSRNQVISVQYGTVENVQQVAMAPSYGASSLIGGALGLLATGGRSNLTKVAGTAAGAGLGALVAKETAGTAERFTVRLVNNSTIDIVLENQDVRVGDCVSVEQGTHANLRRVSSVLCSTPASHPAYSSMNAETARESSDCLAAKQALLKAATTEQTDIAYKKMRAFCES